MKLLAKALLRCILGVLFTCIILFLPAGTVYYPGAWLFMAILFIPMLFAGIILYKKAPELLQKRLNANEQNRNQKLVILFSSLLFIAVFVLAGLDCRFGWSNVPVWCTVLGVIAFLAGYSLYLEVMRENAYLSRTVEIQQGQKLVDTGLYGLVRHPMYFATVLLFLAMPLVLGSFVAFIIMLIGYLPILVLRILDEEKTLAAGLPGYEAYMKKVRFRLIPYIW